MREDRAIQGEERRVLRRKMLDKTAAKPGKYSRNTRTARAIGLAFYFLTPSPLRASVQPLQTTHVAGYPTSALSPLALSLSGISQMPEPEIRGLSTSLAVTLHTAFSYQALTIPPLWHFSYTSISPVPTAISKVRMRVGSIFKLTAQLLTGLLSSLFFCEMHFAKHCHCSFWLKLGDEWFSYRWKMINTCRKWFDASVSWTLGCRGSF